MSSAVLAPIPGAHNQYICIGVDFDRDLEMGGQGLFSINERVFLEPGQTASGAYTFTGESSGQKLAHIDGSVSVHGGGFVIRSASYGGAKGRKRRGKRSGKRSGTRSGKSHRTRRGKRHGKRSTRRH